MAAACGHESRALDRPRSSALVVSFIVALGVVEWFLQWVRRHGFTFFAIYRILLGVALLIWGARIVGS